MSHNKVLALIMGLINIVVFFIIVAIYNLISVGLLLEYSPLNIFDLNLDMILNIIVNLLVSFIISGCLNDELFYWINPTLIQRISRVCLIPEQWYVNMNNPLFIKNYINNRRSLGELLKSCFNNSKINISNFIKELINPNEINQN